MTHGNRFSPTRPLRVASGLLTAIWLSLAADIARRFTSTGIDLVGALSVTVPAIIALFSLEGLLARPVGKEVHSLSSVAALRRFLIASLVMLGLTLLVWFNLGWISGWYTDWGIAKYSEKGLPPVQSQHDFERAIALDPRNARAYYLLGRVFEGLLDDEKAVENHRIAFAFGFELSGIRLGRLYLLRRDVDKAAEILFKARRVLNETRSNGIAEEDRELNVMSRSDLFTLLAWVRWEQGRYQEAEAFLRTVDQLGMHQTELAGCLWGALYRERGLVGCAAFAFQRCLDGKLEVPEHDRWLPIASEFFDLHAEEIGECEERP